MGVAFIEIGIIRKNINFVAEIKVQNTSDMVGHISTTIGDIRFDNINFARHDG